MKSKDNSWCEMVAADCSFAGGGTKKAIRRLNNAASGLIGRVNFEE